MSASTLDDTPPNGARWTALIPRWVKLVAPAVTVLIAIVGFILAIAVWVAR